MEVHVLAFGKSPRVRAANEICEIAETQTTYITDEFSWAFKKSKIVFKMTDEH